MTAVSGDSVTLSGGQQTRVIRPAQERAEQHIDLAYAITAHGAQGQVKPLPSRLKVRKAAGN
ncbi:hypothetical protein CRM80_30190 [Escherichia coli]|nr:hypothetical protein CRM80_30190 [Escherichia coli]